MQKKWYAEKKNDSSVYFAAASESEKHAEILQEARKFLTAKTTEEAIFKIEIFTTKQILGSWNITIHAKKTKRSKAIKHLHEAKCEWQAKTTNGTFFSAPTEHERHADVLRDAKLFLSKQIGEKTSFRIMIVSDSVKKDAWTIVVYPFLIEGSYFVCGGQQSWVYKQIGTDFFRLCTNIYNVSSWNTPIAKIEHRIEFASFKLEDIISYLERTGRTEEAQRIKILEDKNRKKDNGGAS